MVSIESAPRLMARLFLRLSLGVNLFSNLVFKDFGCLGALGIDQHGITWLSKSVRDGLWTQNMNLGS